MPVDLKCRACLKLWQKHGAVTAELRVVSAPVHREKLEQRLREAEAAIREHERQSHQGPAEATAGHF